MMIQFFLSGFWPGAVALICSPGSVSIIFDMSIVTADGSASSLRVLFGLSYKFTSVLSIQRLAGVNELILYGKRRYWFGT